MKRMGIWSMFAACSLAASASAADLTLFTDDGFQGRPLNVVIDLRQLGVMNFNDRASLSELGLEDRITSVRRRDPADPGIFSDTPVTPR